MPDSALIDDTDAIVRVDATTICDVTITTGLVDTYSTPTLSRLIATHQLDAARFATHHFSLDQMMEA